MSEVKKSGRWPVFIMIAMVVGVLIAGYLVFPKNPEQREVLLSKLGTTNHGELLLSPVQIQKLELVDQQNNPWVFENEPHKWRLVLLGGANCTAECDDLLFMTRQVHLRLGKYTGRFQRIYLTEASQLDETLEQKFSEQHPYLKVLKASSGSLQPWLASLGIDSNQQALALLVDQNGLAMMRYGHEHQGGEMLEDINHLMKYSSDR